MTLIHHCLDMIVEPILYISDTQLGRVISQGPYSFPQAGVEQPAQSHASYQGSALPPKPPQLVEKH